MGNVIEIDSNIVKHAIMRMKIGKAAGPGHMPINSVALVRERTIPTERPPPVGEVSANFCG